MWLDDTTYWTRLSVDDLHELNSVQDPMEKGGGWITPKIGQGCMLTIPGLDSGQDIDLGQDPMEKGGG